MTEFPQLIYQSLLHRGTVAVPGFGIFTLERTPASLDEQGNTIAPPARRIVFRADFQLADQQLLTDLQQQGLTAASAQETITSAVSYWKKVLSGNRMLELPLLGTFFPDQEMHFTGKIIEGEIPEYFGLEKISLSALSHAQASPTVPASRTSVFRSPWFWAVLLGVPLLVAAAVWHYGADRILGAPTVLESPKPAQDTPKQHTLAAPAPKDSVKTSDSVTAAQQAAVPVAGAAATAHVAKKWTSSKNKYSSKKHKKYPQKSWRKAKRRANRSR